MPVTRKLSAARITWFQRWIAEECETGTDLYSFAVRFSDLLISWRTWSVREMGKGAAFFVQSKRSLGMALHQLGFQNEKTSHGPLYLGIRLKRSVERGTDGY